MATDQLINKTQGDAIIAGLTAIKNAINDQPVPTQVEDVVSDAFDVGVSYVPGDYCIYENKLYKCDVAHHGAWDGNDFTLTNVGAELDTLNNALNKQIFALGQTNSTLNGTANINIGFKPSKFILFSTDSNNNLAIYSYNGESTCDVLFVTGHNKETRTIGASNCLINDITSSGITLLSYSNVVSNVAVMLVVFG